MWHPFLRHTILSETNKLVCSEYGVPVIEFLQYCESRGYRDVENNSES